MREITLLALLFLFLPASCILHQTRDERETEEGWVEFHEPNYEIDARGSFNVHNHVKCTWAFFEEPSLTTLAVISPAERAHYEGIGWTVRDVDFFNVIARGKVRVQGIKENWTDKVRWDRYGRSVSLLVRR